jgi:ribosome-associated translation inhibitor RaiA
MVYNLNIEGIRLDIQAVDFELDESFLNRIEASIARIRRFYSGDIIYADFYLKRETNHSVNEKSLHIKLGIPGQDPFAAEKGDDWGVLLKDATEQIIRQVQKQHKTN